MDRKSLEDVKLRVEAMLAKVLRGLKDGESERDLGDKIVDGLVELVKAKTLTQSAVAGARLSILLEKLSRSAVLLFDGGTENQTLIGASVDVRGKSLWEDDRLVVVDNRFRVERFTLDQVSFASRDEAESVEEAVEVDRVVKKAA